MQIVRGKDVEFSPASHENPENPGVLKKVLATKSDLIMGQVQMVNWARLPAGKSFQRHYHEDMQEIFVFCEGQIEVDVNGKVEQLSRGDAILIDPREVHQMTSTGSIDAIYVVFGISTRQNGKTVIVD